MSSYDDSRPRVGLNAQLLSFGQSYRGAGLSRYIRSLLRHLPEADDAFDYHAFVGDARAAYPGWTAHRAAWSTERPLARIVWEQAAQPRAARGAGLSLLHAPAYVAPLAAPCPTVVSVHDLSFYRYPELFRRFNRTYLQRFTRWSLARATCVLASSESTRRDLIDLVGVPAERIHVVHLGVDAEMRPIGDRTALAALRSRAGLPERFILYLGTLEPRKCVPTLVEAYAQLAARPGFSHSLVIAGGKGWYHEEIAASVERHGLGERVILPGYVPDGELPLWYSAADLFVYPSLYEGFGLPPLEAMACGTPVVTSSASSLPEVVGDAGLTVAPQDSQSLAEAIDRLLEDPVLRDLCRQRGLARAAQFSWAAVARRTAQVYRQVLEGAIP